MDNRPLGVFDSGLGGLSVVRQLMRRLPGESIVYFGDTARVPYGTRSRDTIEKYARQACRFLLEQDVKLIIAACGTVSSAAPHVLAQQPVPALGVVEPTADAAARATRNGRIGVLGTAATVSAGAFRRRILAQRPDVQVWQQPCPLFVPLVENGWIDRDYVARYVHGFEAYAAYAAGFNSSNVEALTGVPYEQAALAAKMMARAERMCVSESSAPIGHHANGMQSYRAIMALLAITGNYDRPGGQLPAPHTYMEMPCGFETREEEFMNGRFPAGAPAAVGAERFPLWYECRREGQAMDLSRRILTGAPRPMKAVFSLGMNLRMFPGDGKLIEALKALDFFVDVDLFLTDTAKYADIVLPACTSMERGELKCYPGGYLWYTSPVVEPLGKAKSDADILTLLAQKMDLDDDLLKAGYDACSAYILQDLPVSIDALRQSPAPVKLPNFAPPEAGKRLEKGLPTPTGKFELYSEVIAAHPEWGLDPLPTYTPPKSGGAEYPYTLSAGVRIPNALHSRLHDVPWARSLRPEPGAEISLEDAETLGVEEGDRVHPLGEHGPQGPAHRHRPRRGGLHLPRLPGVGHERPAGPRRPGPLLRLPSLPERLLSDGKGGGSVSRYFELDIDRCCACGACAIACMDQNDVDIPAGERPFRTVFRQEPERIGACASYYSVACMHCDNALCVLACPVGCLYKDEATGLTLFDNTDCIGCHSCAMACPFGAPAFGANGKMRKCDGCVERLRAGEEPACVRVCPTGALTLARDGEIPPDHSLREVCARLAKEQI